MQIKEKYNIIITGPEALLCRGLGALIEEMALQAFVPDFRWEGRPQNPCTDGEPDAVVYPVYRVGGTGHQLADIGRCYPGAPVLVVCHEICDAGRQEVLEADVRGLLTGRVTADDLYRALTCLVNGGRYYPEDFFTLPRLTARLQRKYDDINRYITGPKRDILKLLAAGYSSRQIAKRLNRSLRTIHWHKEKMLEISETNSTIQLVLLASKLGIIELDC